SWSVEAGSDSDGFLARSESAVAPGYDRGGRGALDSLGMDLFLIWVIGYCFFLRGWRPLVRPFSFHGVGLWTGVEMGSTQRNSKNLNCLRPPPVFWHCSSSLVQPSTV